MTPSTHNTEGQKCACGSKYLRDKPVCGLPFSPHPDLPAHCSNEMCDGSGERCAHGIACHTLSTPAEPKVSISLKHAYELEWMASQHTSKRDSQREAHGALILAIEQSCATEGK
jgi:hypothetical protein